MKETIVLCQNCKKTINITETIEKALKQKEDEIKHYKILEEKLNNIIYDLRQNLKRKDENII